jgi:undecaprenyl diphosphate synthase
MSDLTHHSASEQLPRHIAIIMDGNGRWAQDHGKPRTKGHQQGAAIARDTMIACSDLGVEALTLYSFSTENWKRPAEEINFLMELGVQYLESEAQTILDHNIRFCHVGHRDQLSDAILAKLDQLTEASSANTGLKMNLALNYGSRSEITHAVRQIAAKVADGTLDVEQIDESVMDAHLFTAGLPDPDLLIRTAGEMRLSNFLLWQISYAELWITDVLWPEFSKDRLLEAIASFAQRKRKFGDVALNTDG